MNYNLINRYINKLKKDDINNFLKTENIVLTEKELNYIFGIIKNDYIRIIEKDKKIFNDIKKNINEDQYIKLLELFEKYKTIYLN